MNNTNAQKYKSSTFNLESRTKNIAIFNLNKLARLTAISLFLLLSTISSFNRVQAASLTYYLQDVNFFGVYQGLNYGGGGVTGSFMYDSKTGLFSNVNIVADTDSFSDTFTLAGFAEPSIPNSIYFTNGSLSRFFRMGLAGEIPTVSGASIGICGQIIPGGALSSCPYGVDSIYASPGTFGVTVQVGPYQPLLTVGSSTEVPEPSTVAGLFAFITLGAFALRNRRCIKP
jgi:hypothetical protein